MPAIPGLAHRRGAGVCRSSIVPGHWAWPGEVGVKKVLLQLDTDAHPSAFDAIVAVDAGVEVLVSYGPVEPDDVQGLVHGAFFTRGIEDLKNTAIFVGGSSVPAGEAIMDAVQAAFFGPFQVSVLHDSDGCNTTAAALVAKIVSAVDVHGKRVVIVGVGPVGLRSATLLMAEGAEVVGSSIPADVLGTDSYRRPRGLSIAEDAGIRTIEPADRAELLETIKDAQIVITSGPAGVAIIDEQTWKASDTLEVLADVNATEPLGIEGVEVDDDLTERHGKRTLGALAVGGPKMKTQKKAIQTLFEANHHVLDAEAVYTIAKTLI
jgi:methylenetetrahydrofolate/methylenetetrahydromethanopterin dehydrogenase (NADP+)